MRSGAHCARRCSCPAGTETAARGAQWPRPTVASAALRRRRLPAPAPRCSKRTSPSPRHRPPLVPQHQILQRIVVLPHGNARRLDLQLHVRRLAVHERRSAARRRLLHGGGSTPRLPHPVLPHVCEREHRRSVGHLGLHANHLAQLVHQRGDGAREEDSHRTGQAAKERQHDLGC